jgi:methyltransferase (TIGR00027 family)
MQEGKPSGTAYRVALRRAAHQLVDDPVVFHDPLALRILGLSADDPRGLAESDLRAPGRPTSVSLRAFVVARSQFAEDTLAAAVGDVKATQYVLLGAGLDTFAYRNPFAGVRVFEVDHPDTQRWKRALLCKNGVDVPQGTAYVPVDFHHDSLRDRLAEAGFDEAAPAVFAWLGVVPYLTADGFAATLKVLSGCAAGSTLVMDYGLPRASLPLLEQMAFDSLAARVAAVGEPFQLFFTPEAIRAELEQWGWRLLEDLHRDAINARYFAGRNDHLRCLATAGHLLAARLQG